MTVLDRARIMARQDDCLIAITDGKRLPAEAIVNLPPWRATLLARVAAKAGIGIEGGTLEELVSEARRVGGDGKLVWPPPFSVERAEFEHRVRTEIDKEFEGEAFTQHLAASIQAWVASRFSFLRVTGVEVRRPTVDYPWNLWVEFEWTGPLPADEVVRSP